MSRMKFTVLLFALVFVCVGLLSCKKQKSVAKGEAVELTEHPATDAYEGWRLGIQCWTFRKFTFYEAVDKTAALGLDWMEAYPGQPLSKENPDLKFIHTMSKQIRRQVKQKLEDAGVRVVDYGVVGVLNDETECRKLFDFAKDMGIEVITSEPPEDTFDLLEKLCKEYNIKLAKLLF